MAPEIAQFLLHVINDSTYPEPVRVGAAKGLGYGSADGVLQGLKNAVNNRQLPGPIRAAAAEALGHACSDHR